MDLRVCEYFLAILEEGSMNKAAAALHVTQPTLSRQIAQLEDDLGVTLFERKAKSLQLTSEGLLFAKRAQELLSIESRTRIELQSISKGIQGVLTIGAGEFSACRRLLQLAGDFTRRYPDVTITMITGNADQIKEQIEDGSVDLGLFLEPVDLCGYEILPFPEKEQWTAIVPADHPLADHSALTPLDLAGQPLIFPYRKGPSCLLRQWFGSGIAPKSGRTARFPQAAPRWRSNISEFCCLCPV